MDNSKKKPKSIEERHKRRTLDFSFPHIKIVFVITATALLSLIASIALLSTPKEYIDERSRLQTEAALLFG